MKERVAFTTLSLLSLLGAACSTPARGARHATGGNRSAAIALRGIAFAPTQVSMAVGGVVTWTDREDVEHTVTAGTPSEPDPARFDRVLHNGETFNFTFTEPGRYPFYCRRHPANMQGSVIVE